MLTRNQAESIALNTFAYSTIVNVGEVFIKDGLFTCYVTISIPDLVPDYFDATGKCYEYVTMIQEDEYGHSTAYAPD